MSTPRRDFRHACGWGARRSLCALAFAGVAAGVADVEAAIVVFTTPIAVPSTADGIYINLLTGASASSPAAVPGWDFNPWASSGVLAFFWNGTPAGTSGGLVASATGPYVDLPPGSVIGPTSTFSASTSPAMTVAFQSTGTHVLGFRFFNETTTRVNYGYLTLSTTGPAGFPAVITSWAYDNSGASFSPLLPPPVIPEPSTRAMLLIGALALAAAGLRRDRRMRQGSRAGG